MEKIKKILVAHSESKASGLIGDQLKKNINWKLFESDNIDEIDKKCETGFFDIVLFGGDHVYSYGLKLYKKYRKSDEIRPYIFIIDDIYKFDKARNELPGDPEILITPFYLNDLIKKICRILEKQENPKGKSYVLGGFNFYPGLKILIQISNASSFVKLTDKENAILEHLCKYKNELVPRDVLLEAVLGYNDEVTTHTLETHIYRIRQKIEKNISNTSILVTETGGYRIKV
tara:strand:+ start:1888 stop:2580 length:693 start_codon:yes stop_codon:yes gene_type:complete